MAMGDGQWAMGKSMTKRFFVVPIASRTFLGLAPVTRMGGRPLNEPSPLSLPFMLAVLAV